MSALNSSRRMLFLMKTSSMVLADPVKTANSSRVWMWASRGSRPCTWYKKRNPEWSKWNRVTQIRDEQWKAKKKKEVIYLQQKVPRKEQGDRHQPAPVWLLRWQSVLFLRSQRTNTWCCAASSSAWPMRRSLDHRGGRVDRPQQTAPPSYLSQSKQHANQMKGQCSILWCSNRKLHHVTWCWFVTSYPSWRKVILGFQPFFFSFSRQYSV